MEKKIYTDEIKEGMLVEDVFRVQEVRGRITSKGDRLVRFFLEDKKGRFPALIWGAETDPEEGEVYMIRGRAVQSRYVESGVEVWVENFERVEEYDEELLKPALPEFYPKIEKVKDQIQQLADSIQDEKLRKLLRLFFKRWGERFFEARASYMYHHAFLGGLALHSYMTATVARYLAELYNLDKDLITAAALLHDAGKILELTEEGRYTEEGLLQGHLILSAQMVEKLAEEAGLDRNVKNRLLHIIISHHGELSNGSPLEPRTPEAFVVHIADLLDSHIYMFEKEMRRIQAGDKAVYSKILKRKVFYGEITEKIKQEEV